MTDSLIDRLEAHADLHRQWDAFELGMEGPPPIPTGEPATLLREAAEALREKTAPPASVDREAWRPTTPVTEYTQYQQRVATYIWNTSGIGGGDDPVGFLIDSHAFINETAAALRAVKAEALLAEGGGDRGPSGADIARTGPVARPETNSLPNDKRGS